ncbi:protein-disulfide reductase DsbD family protein [Methylobacterium nonmethylotrophicum]|uniref:Thiol:disulfide interchange protein n=1 Tax=Methylobacterium nonmethylotrophicum TaxID=1141884 RepID=A0A4Z0NEF8_9HYPH|nr:protein-disulfide reductase DsbD domain-containing protein [Methylobacterium nonmethylotrophicum]TGD92276.1 thiol:disulfide interchange protein [Methylobacterium nonmethylotrophicum]
MTRLLPALLLVLAGLSGAHAQGPSTPKAKTPSGIVRASLVAEPAAIEPGKAFAVGVRMVMKPGWHVYWRNPGDSGLPPEVNWTLPEGFSAGAIDWPAPTRIPVAHLVNHGFKGETVLLTQVTPPATLPAGRPVNLDAKLSYLACEEICIPGSADLRLTLPVAEAGTSAGADPRNAELFAKARDALPDASPWPVRLTQDGKRLVLHLDAEGLKPDAVRAVHFFPYAETAIENAAAQDLTVDASGLHLALTRATPDEPMPGDLPGVLTFEEGGADGPVRRALAIGTAPTTAPAAGAVGEAAPAPSGGDEALTLWTAVGLALLGGLLLNLMPCVFPVLSIKVLSLVQHSGEPPARVRLHGLAYTAGVLAAFLALAGILIILKSGGAGVGWGFQLQSPVVVAALAYLLFAMGLSLSGVVHVGAGITGIGDGLTRRSGLQGSFFTGVLATVVATPCTAPFMGTAVGFALTQTPFFSLMVFASLGLGLALPFLILTTWPAVVRRLPRPGAWMETVKGVLAFPIYATVAWLVWVLAQQVGPSSLFATLIGLVLVGSAAWIWERARAAGPLGMRLAQGAALAALLAVAGLTASLAGDSGSARVGATAEADGVEPFTQARLDGLRTEGRSVFVNMTAAWCITCQVNERTAIATDDVRAAFKARNVAYLKGDWTNQNPEITRLLERHGRSGVPLYLLYEGSAPPAVLPQILTKGLVLAELDRLKVPERRADEPTLAARK